MRAIETGRRFQPEKQICPAPPYFCFQGIKYRFRLEHVAFDQGLAEKLEAPCHTLEDLRADTLCHTVLDVLE